LHYGRTVEDSAARLGLIVPKRLARAASLRNAIKRQGREAFRLVAFEIQPCDMVLRLKRPLVGVRAADSAQRKVWRAEIEALLRRLPLQAQ
jgi:ribonuclease P protein component